MNTASTMRTQVMPGEPDSLTQELVEGLLAPVLPAVKGLGGEVVM